MKFYYILSVLDKADLDFFKESIVGLKKYQDIDKLVEKKFYRVDKKMENGETWNTMTLEAWMFIKHVWKNYGVTPDNITWVYKQNLVILNDNLWLYNYNNLWEKIENNGESFFCASRYAFGNNPFWSFWEKMTKIDNKFPKIMYPNKKLSYFKNEKTCYISNMYEDREKYLGNFMFPLMYSRGEKSIKDLLLLWKKETGENTILLKKSYGTDNGKDITLLNIDDYVKDPQKLDYLFLSYISKISEYNPNIFFTSFYSIDREYRLYLSRTKGGKYKLYSAKEKINLTKEEELYKKTNLSTGYNMRVSWKVFDLKDIPKEVVELGKKILDKNGMDISVIEFVKTTEGDIRFLEINCLGGAMMFKGKDEENIKSFIDEWWGYIFDNSNEPVFTKKYNSI